MSRIDDLIRQLCPDGVVFRPLGEVARIRNGKDYKSFSEGEVPVYGSGGVMTHIDNSIHRGPSVLIPRKGSLGNLYFLDKPFWTVDTIFYTEIHQDLVVPKFLYYYLLTQRLAYLNEAAGVPSLTQSVLNRVAVPVPPMEVQREIVRVLDSFTALEAELEAELSARRQQYEHYRSDLLSFPSAVTGFGWTTLGAVADIGTGSNNTNEAVESGRYPFFVRSQSVLRKDTWDYDETAIITSGDGVGVGKIFHYVEGKYALHQRAYRIRILDARLLSQFFFYFMRDSFTSYMTQQAVHASVTSVRRWMLDDFPVPVPPLAEQERIVGILDRFDALVNDIAVGLPAELAARRKQYEHYRDRLLTFKEAA